MIFVGLGSRQGRRRWASLHWTQQSNWMVAADGRRQGGAETSGCPKRRDGRRAVVVGAAFRLRRVRNSFPATGILRRVGGMVRLARCDDGSEKSEQRFKRHGCCRFSIRGRHAQLLPETTPERVVAALMRRCATASKTVPQDAVAVKQLGRKCNRPPSTKGRSASLSMETTRPTVVRCPPPGLLSSSGQGGGAVMLVLLARMLFVVACNRAAIVVPVL